VTPGAARRYAHIVPIGGAVLILLVLVALALDLAHERAETLAAAERSNENLVRALVEQTALTVQTIDLTLRAVARAQTRGRLRSAPGSHEAREVLQQARAGAPFIQALFVTDARGVAIHSSVLLPATPIDLGDRAYFTRQRDHPGLGLYIGSPVMSRAFGRWFIGMSRRLTTPDGGFAGVVVAAVEPRYFQKFYDALRIGQDGAVTMFLRDGTLLVRSPPIESAVGQSFAHLPLFQTGGPAAGAAGSLRRPAAIDGVARLLSYRTVPDLPLVVFVSTSQAAALARWWRTMIIETSAALVFIGMMAGFTTLLTRQVRRLSESEDRFRSLFAHSPDAVLLTTPDGHILDANAAAERLFALTAAQLRTSERGARVDPGDPRVAAALHEQERTGRFHGELNLRRADGTVFPADLTMNSFQDSHGARRTVAIIRDVSERRRLEAQVHLQAAALEAAANAILITDREGTIVWSNLAATALTGYPVAELWGRNPRVLKSGQNPPALYEDLWQTIAAGRSWHGVLSNRRKDGTVYAEEQTIAPVLDAGGAISHFIAIKQDITARLQAEAEVTRAQTLARQQERLAEMGRLLAGVAHELNNPLSVVLGHATLLQQTASSDVATRRAAKLIEAAQRCARIVKNFLALAREYPPETRGVALNTLVRDTVELLGYALRVDNIAVVLDLADDLPDLAGDPHQLQQVLMNLVTNASHALRTAPTLRRLTLATRHDAGRERAILEVRDTGPGIAGSVQPRLFEPFVTTKPVGEGTGLGLAICKGIVERHGGTIAVESAEGQGTTFRIELPIRPVPAAEPEPADRTAEGLDLSVLVIDDEREVAEVLGEMVAIQGHHVDTAVNGAAALALVRARAYDVIFCDHKMPVMDGPEFYAALIRERPDLASRVVFLTGDTFSSATSAFLAEAGRPVINKPFSADDVRRAVAIVTTR
jgi:PAS domain S-box-containing protein